MWQAIIRGQLHHLQLMETQFFYFLSEDRKNGHLESRGAQFLNFLNKNILLRQMKMFTKKRLLLLLLGGIECFIEAELLLINLSGKHRQLND